MPGSHRISPHNKNKARHALPRHREVAQAIGKRITALQNRAADHTAKVRAKPRRQEYILPMYMPAAVLSLALGGVLLGGSTGAGTDKAAPAIEAPKPGASVSSEHARELVARRYDACKLSSISLDRYMQGGPNNQRYYAVAIQSQLTANEQAFQVMLAHEGDSNFKTEAEKPVVRMIRAKNGRLIAGDTLGSDKQPHVAKVKSDAAGSTAVKVNVPEQDAGQWFALYIRTSATTEQGESSITETVELPCAAFSVDGGHLRKMSADYIRNPYDHTLTYQNVHAVTQVGGSAGVLRNDPPHLAGLN
jgi:hypothetical protein